MRPEGEAPNSHRCSTCGAELPRKSAEQLKRGGRPPDKCPPLYPGGPRPCRQIPARISEIRLEANRLIDAQPSAVAGRTRARIRKMLRDLADEIGDPPIAWVDRF